MIDVTCDQAGVRTALEEIFEEDFARSRIQIEGAGDAMRARLEAQIPKRTLSPGYYEFAVYLLRLEAQQKAGITLLASDLVAAEVRGIVAVAEARANFGYKHPPCEGCGARQQNRFSRECGACGAKFRRKE